MVGRQYSINTGIATVRKSLPVTREQFFLYMAVFSTLFAAAGEVQLFGCSVKGWAWLLMLVLAAFYLIPSRRQAVKFPWYAWVPWFLWVAYKTDFSEREAVQRLAIFLTPVLVGIASSSFRKVNVDTVKKAYQFLCIGSLCIYSIAVVQSSSLLANTEWYVVEGIAMTFTLIAVAAIASITKTSKLGFATFGLCMLILLVTKSRAPLLILPFLLVFGYTTLRSRARFLLCALLGVAVWAIFTAQFVQENLFRSGYGTVGDVINLDPSLLKVGGRLNAWPQYIGSVENIWFGDGSMASVVFGNATFGAGKWSHPHNEYIRVLFDYGIVGIVLLSIAMLWLVVSLYKQSQLGDKSEKMRWLYCTSINGLFAILLLGISGNVLMYVAFIGNMLFATIGFSFACKLRQ